MKHKSEAPQEPEAAQPPDPGRPEPAHPEMPGEGPGKRYPDARPRSGPSSRRSKRDCRRPRRIAPERPDHLARDHGLSSTRESWSSPALVVLAVVAAIVIILSVLPGKKTALRASGKPTIAVVNFENKTGDKDLDKWSTGIRDLLITDLAQSKFMDVLSDSDIYGILKKFDLADASTYSTDDLVKIADAGGAQYTVNGSFLKAGDKIIINATCQKPHSRDVISPIQMTFPGFEEIKAKIDEMTRKIKADLNLTQAQIAGDIDQNIGEISTPNAEAWAYYVEARRYHFRGESEKAIPLLQKALALDPEFIMAIGLWRAAHHQYRLTIPNPENIRARPLSLFKSIRSGFRNGTGISSNRIITLCQTGAGMGESRSKRAGSCSLFIPTILTGNFEMGDIYRDIEEWDEALKYYEKCVGGRSRFVGPMRAWPSAYRAKGEPAKAQEVLERYLREVENTAAGHRSLAYHHITQNRLDLAARELETAETLAPDDYGESRASRGPAFL